MVKQRRGRPPLCWVTLKQDGDGVGVMMVHYSFPDAKRFVQELVDTAVAGEESYEPETVVWSKMDTDDQPSWMSNEVFGGQAQFLIQRAYILSTPGKKGYRIRERPAKRTRTHTIHL